MKAGGYIVGLLALVLSSGSGWAQSCPKAPSGSRPGWSVLLYDSHAKTGGLIADAPYAATQVRGFPLKYGDIEGLSNAATLPKVVFKGNFVACEAGHYEFALIIQAGSNRAPRSLLCKGFVQSGTTKLIAVDPPGRTALIGRGLQQPFSGAMELSKGNVDLEISLLCGSQSFGGRTTVMKKHPDEMLLDTALTLRVRGPNDPAPREFKPGEIYNGPGN